MEDSLGFSLVGTHVELLVGSLKDLLMNSFGAFDFSHGVRRGSELGLKLGVRLGVKLG